MSAAAIPCAFSAAITFVISTAFARSAAEAVFASLETPKESCARSGTVATEPLPDTTIECWVVAEDAPPAPAAPARRATTATARTASERIRPLYAAGRTGRHIGERHQLPPVSRGRDRHGGRGTQPPAVSTPHPPEVVRLPAAYAASDRSRYGFQLRGSPEGAASRMKSTA